MDYDLEHNPQRLTSNSKDTSVSLALVLEHPILDLSLHLSTLTPLSWWNHFDERLYTHTREALEEARLVASPNVGVSDDDVLGCLHQTS
jgi:hypothetical protein